MTEFSYPWSGTTVGDAGPYKAQEWQDAWGAMNLFWPPSADDLGIASGISVATPGINALQVGPGEAFIRGSYYTTTANLNFVVPSGALITHRLVLVKDWVAQTIRFKVEQDSGAPPIIQNFGVLWEEIHYTFLIDNFGNITNFVQRSEPLHLNTHVSEEMLDPLSVSNSKIQNDAVTTIKILDKTVTSQKLDDRAIRFLMRQGIAAFWTSPGTQNFYQFTRLTMIGGLIQLPLAGGQDTASVLIPFPETFVSPGALSWCSHHNAGYQPPGGGIDPFFVSGLVNLAGTNIQVRVARHDYGNGKPPENVNVSWYVLGQMGVGVDPPNPDKTAD